MGGDGALDALPLSATLEEAQGNPRAPPRTKSKTTALAVSGVLSPL